ncbi:hypothetical protein ACWKSP_38755 [Micromonosporaceae bacterium Da 78-11]
MNSRGVVDFPVDESGRRSSAAFGRAVVADALRAVDPAAAAAAERETDWRRGYLTHFRALVEKGVAGGAYEIAEAGLAAAQSRIRYAGDGADVPLDEALAVPAERPLGTVTIEGNGKPEREVVLPVAGEQLRGAALVKQLADWVAVGAIEASCADAVTEVADHPEWLDLSDQTLVVLGAGAEMGPLPAVLGWGGTVVGVDLPRPELWQRVTATAERGAGRLIAPTAGDTPGADLLSDLGAVAQWLGGIDGRLVVGNYVYAPGAAYPRLSAAVDALGEHLRRERDDVALAFLATPTDVFAVPAEAVAQSVARYQARSRRSRLVAPLTGNRLLQPNYPGGAVPGINDSLVPQQGPNYALAKRIQRWRATVARRDGVVSFAVAPPTRTRSVLSNRLLAAAYAGAHLFDVTVFEPATANKLMAILLVHQIRRPRPAAADAWVDETVSAAHGGLWRTAYHPRTVLGLAAVRGLVRP